MKFKKTLAGVLCFAVIGASVPLADAEIDLTVFATETSNSDFEFVDGKLSVYRGDFSFDANLTGDIYDELGGGWTDKVTSLYIGDDVTIGEGSATGGSRITIWFDNLETIEISENNKNYTVYDGVLYNKDVTKMISYPSGKKDEKWIMPDTLEYGADYIDNPYMKELVIGKSYVGESEWQGDYEIGSLVAISDPDKVKSAFASDKLTALESYSVSDENKFFSVVDGVLYNKKQDILLSYPQNKSDSVFIVPDTVTTINRFAFAKLGLYASAPSLEEDSSSNNLEKVIIGKNTTSIGVSEYDEDGLSYDYSFEFCKKLKDIEVDASNPSYKSVDGVLYNKNMTELYVYPCNKENVSFTIPDSVQEIGGFFSSLETFEGNSHLQSLNINGIIGSFSSLDGIIYYIIYYDHGDSDGRLHFCPRGRKSEVKISDSITRINYNAFEDCTSLTSVTIPDSVTSIDNCAFSGCNSLTDVYYNGTETEWNSISIGSYNECLTNATIHYLKTKILGDPSGDGKIDSKDAVIVLQSYAKSIVSDSDNYDEYADVNKDGKVDSKDAVIILKYFAASIVGDAGNIRNYIK